jgi:predicted Zn-dependent protease
VDIVLINDRSINAFVAGGQIVYVHSGLITAADNANEVQGVIAHELGHVTGGHVIGIQQGAKAATGIMLLSLLLGAAAMAAGGGEAGAGIMAAGQAAAMGKFLAFSRTQESAADSAGAKYLTEAGISGKGSLSFFKKLQNLEFRYAVPQEDSYARTHPLSASAGRARGCLQDLCPSWKRRPSRSSKRRVPSAVRRSWRASSTITRQTLVQVIPRRDKTVPRANARAYAWHKSASPKRRTPKCRHCSGPSPRPLYFLELKGRDPA